MVSSVICPLCGSPVRVPEASPGSRATCSKCHAPLHLNNAMHPVIGPPPDPELEFEALKQTVHESLRKFPTGKVIAGAALVLIVWMGVAYLIRPVDALKPASERAARAIAEGDPSYLKSIAAADTAADVARWYDEVHAQLLKRRETWAGKAEGFDVGLAQENQATRKGTVAMSFHPTVRSARDVSLASPDQMTAGADAPVDTTTEWVLNRHGHWELDGRATYQKLHPPDPAPPLGNKSDASTARK